MVNESLEDARKRYDQHVLERFQEAVYGGFHKLPLDERINRKGGLERARREDKPNAQRPRGDQDSKKTLIRRPNMSPLP